MERARFNWSLWDSGFSLQIRYRRIDSILLKAENRFVSWQTQQIFHPGYACGLEPLLVLVRLKSCWELTVRMGILSQYQLLQTHAGTHRDLNTHKPQDRGKKKKERKEGTGRQRLGKWHDNWLLFLLIGYTQLKTNNSVLLWWEMSVILLGGLRLSPQGATLTPIFPGTPHLQPRGVEATRVE